MAKCDKRVKWIRHIIPEITGTVAIVFVEDSAPVRYPIIGWLIETEPHATDKYDPEPFYVTPIACDSLEGDIYCLELRDHGKPYMWVFQGDCECDSFDDAMAHGELCLSRNKQYRAQQAALKAMATGPIQ